MNNTRPPCGKEQQTVYAHPSGISEIIADCPRMHQRNQMRRMWPPRQRWCLQSCAVCTSAPDAAEVATAAKKALSIIYCHKLSQARSRGAHNNCNHCPNRRLKWSKSSKYFLESLHMADQILSWSSLTVNRIHVWTLAFYQSTNACNKQESFKTTTILTL